MADDHELGLGSELVQQGQEAVQVHVVEGGLHLVHHVEGRGATAEHGEQKGQRGQRPLPARQQRELPHVLARGPGRYLDPGVERVVGVLEAEPAPAAGEQRLEQRLEVGGHVGEGGLEHRPDLVVDGGHDLGQVAPGPADVVELVPQVLPALLEGAVLLQGQRVDRAHDLQIPFELLHPLSGRDAGVQFRGGGGDGRVGGEAVIGPQPLHRALKAGPQLGLLHIVPGAGGAQLLQPPLGGRRGLPQPVQAGDDGPGLLGLASAAPVGLRQLRVDQPGPVLDLAAEPGQDRTPAVEGLGRSRRGPAPGLVVLQAGGDLAQPSLQQPPTLVEPGGQGPDAGPPVGDQRGLLVDGRPGLGPQLAPLLVGGLGQFRRPGLSAGQDGPSLGQSGGGLVAGGPGQAGPDPGLVDQGPQRADRARAPPPAPRAETIPIGGDGSQLGMIGRHPGRRLPAAVDHHHRPQQDVQQPLHRRGPGPNPVAEPEQARRQVRGRVGGGGRDQDRAGPLLQEAAGGAGVGHHHGSGIGAQSGGQGGFSPLVGVDEIAQWAQHPVGGVELGRPGRRDGGAAGVGDHRGEGLQPGLGPVVLGLGLPQRLGRSLSRRRGFGRGRLSLPEVVRQGSGAGHIGGAAGAIGPGSPPAAEIGPHGGQCGLQFGQLGPVRPQGGGGVVDLGQFGPAPAGLALQVGDDVAVQGGGPLPVDAAAALGHHRGQTPGPLPQSLEPGQGPAEIVAAAGRQALLAGGDLSAQILQFGADGSLIPRPGLGYGGQGPQPVAQPGDLAAGQIDPQRGEFGHEVAVAAGGLGLLLQGPELAADLAHQVPGPDQIALHRLQAALSPLPALAVLEDAGGLLDDRPAVGGVGVEHRVHLGLGHDHVLAAAHPGVGQQLDHIEKPARRAVEGVGRLAVAEQGAGDLHLAELDGQQARGVVDGQGHLGPPQRRALGRPGEHDVVHPLGPHRAGGLGAEHPGDGVHHVGLAAAVGADHHGDAGLEPESGGIPERLEPLEREALQMHADQANRKLQGCSAHRRRTGPAGRPAPAGFRLGCRSSRSKSRRT